jgi:hypothetical protein
MVMTMLVLADQSKPGCVIVRRAPAAYRLRARLCARRLDRALAAGIAPDSRADLEVRAHGLIGPQERTALALSIRRTLADAQRPRRSRNFSIPICRRKVWRSRQALADLVDRLLDYEPVDARGLAQIRLLLTDGAGPLYSRPGADDLAPAVARAIAGLHVQTPSS